jgi:prepilin-type N-terminal cleavage/methylation domain-containing protein
MEIKKKLGFTVTELIIAIVILGIAIALISIKFSGTSTNIYAQTAQLANDIRYTQSLAMARNQHYELVITAATSSYAILAGGSGPSYNYQNMSPPYNITLGSGITFPANYTIIFNSRGIPYSNDTTPLNSTMVIYLNGTTTSVSITPTTGRVTIP